MTANPVPSRRGFSVSVYLPGGDPEGLKVVEKSNWTGRGLVIPRAMFGESKMRVELGRTGVLACWSERIFCAANVVCGRG